MKRTQRSAHHRNRSPQQRRLQRDGFTLIELLVVMAIIGILIAVVVPRMLGVREAARRTTCLNNLRQMGLALTNFEASFGRYPTGGDLSLTSGPGWGPHTTIDPLSGLTNRAGTCPAPDLEQSWGWQYQILHELGQDSLFLQCDPNVIRGTQVSVFHCPSNPGNGKIRNELFPAVKVSGLPLLEFGGTDYAGCVGAEPLTPDPQNPLPTLVADCFSPPLTPNGVFLPIRHHVTAASVTDGLEQTIFVGEKWASPDHVGQQFHGQVVGFVGGEAESTSCLLVGFLATDTLRKVSDDFGPNVHLADDPRPPEVSAQNFGGWHPGGANFLMGDGSVHFMDYGTERSLLRRLATRNDGEIIDGTEF